MATVVQNPWRRLREDAGMTREQLAVKAGVSVSMVRDLETGQRKSPRVDTCQKVAAALGKTLAYFFG